jgi:hypothetical protein
MKLVNILAESPLRLEGGSIHPGLKYERLKDYFAIHNFPNRRWIERAILVLNGGKIAVVRRTLFSEDEIFGPQVIGPVYQLLPNGPLAVPTGLVFVRFDEAISLKEKTPVISRTGYRIDQVLSYAPHAGWLRAESDSISDALRGIDRLEALENVANVEPQVLMESARRKGSPLNRC